MVVRFSVKPGDQIDETESPNLVNKTELKKVIQSFSFFLYSFSLTQLRLGAVKGQRILTKNFCHV